MKFYFNCNNKTQADILREAGVKNIFLNHKYIPKNVEKFIEGFESVMVSPSRDVEPQVYYDFLEDDLPEKHLALQMDDKDVVINLNLFKMGKEYKKGLIPIFHGNYYNNLKLYETELNARDTIALGNMKGIIEEDDALVKMSALYSYHGLGKGRWAKNIRVKSVDSSTWLSGVRGRKTDVFGGQQITFGKKGLTNKSVVQVALGKNQVHVEKLGLSGEKVLKGDYKALMKVTLAVYYMPMFKSLNIYNDNFIS